VLSYFIVTQILLVVGAMFYLLLIRNRMSSINQKRALLTTLGLSLLLPFLSLSTGFTPLVHLAGNGGEHIPINHLNQVVQQPEEVMNASEEMFLADFCPTGGLLEVCYQTAISTQDFCNCPEVEKSSLLMFHSSPWYNFLIWQKGAVWNLLGIAAFFLLLLIAVNMLYLQHLINNSVKRVMNIEGKKVTILYPQKKRAVASFHLWGRYIIWQQEMDDLSEEECHAILWHEMAHISQKDTWIKLLVNLTQVIWMVNPVFYFLKKELDRLSEFVADEFAAKRFGDARAYAQLLFRMKTQKANPANPANSANPANLAMTHAFTGNLLKDRIKHLITPQKELRSPYCVLRIVFISSFLLLASTNILPFVDVQLGKLEVYQNLMEQHRTSGGTVFCKHCHLK